jgi:phosphoribosylformylglycinamidine (FGAM) synthase PurS component
MEYDAVRLHLYQLNEMLDFIIKFPLSISPANFARAVCKLVGWQSGCVQFFECIAPWVPSVEPVTTEDKKTLADIVGTAEELCFAAFPASLKGGRFSARVTFSEDAVNVLWRRQVLLEKGATVSDAMKALGIEESDDLRILEVYEAKISRVTVPEAKLTGGNYETRIERIPREQLGKTVINVVYGLWRHEMFTALGVPFLFLAVDGESKESAVERLRKCLDRQDVSFLLVSSLMHVLGEFPFERICDVAGDPKMMLGVAVTDVDKRLLPRRGGQNRNLRIYN